MPASKVLEGVEFNLRLLDYAEAEPASFGAFSLPEPDSEADPLDEMLKLAGRLAEEQLRILERVDMGNPAYLPLYHALRFQLQSATTLLAAMQAVCSLGNPPADIEMVTDLNGRLQYRCRHTPAHTWPV